jgi:hypothetical protein
VLRLSRDRVLVGLAPEALTLLGVSGAARPRVSDMRTVACDPGFGSEPWQGAAAALARLAGEIGKASAKVTVVLSNHFARFALIPWSEGLGGAEEEAAFARYCFAKIHGERSKDWDLRLSPAPAGSTRIASAVDTSLVQSLKAAFPARAKLASIQPYLMSAFNRLRGQIQGAGAWFLLVEPQRACLIRMERGRWATVRSVRGSFDGPQEWAGLLDRERHLAGGEVSDAVYVHAPLSWNAPSAEAQGWAFRNLELACVEGLPPPAGSGPLAMVLSAL